MKNNTVLSRMFSPRLWNRDYILVLLVCMIASFTNSIFMSILPVYVLDLGGDNALSGAMMSGLTILGVITRIIIAPLIDSVGRKRFLVFGSGLYAVNALMFCFTGDLKIIFVLRVLHGFTQGVFFPVPPTMVADISPADLLVDAMGFFGIASSITFAVTPGIGLAIYRNAGPEAVFIAAAVAAFVSFILAVFVKEHYAPEKAVKIRKDETVRHRSGFDKVFVGIIFAPCLLSVFLAMGNSAVNSFLTPCGLSRGIEQISLFFFVNQVVMIVARLFLGSLLTRISEHACVFVGFVCATIGTVLIAFSNNMSGMLIAAVLYGLGYTAVSQLLQVQVLVDVAENQRGIANSIFMLMSDVGNGIGSALFGGISVGAGYVVTYVWAGLSTLFAAILHFLCYRKKMYFKSGRKIKAADIVNKTGESICD